jgi:alpha-1,2-mannosyltransferase
MSAVMVTAVFVIWPHVSGDFEVYRLAARTVLHHSRRQDLYSTSNPRGLPFTYPPFAVLPLLPLAYGRFAADQLLVRVLLAFALAGLWQASLLAVGHRVRWPLLGLLTAASLALEPVMMDLQAAQISLIVVLLVVVDLTGAVPERYRGILTGVAAALKLTPLIFLVFLALTHQRRALARMIGGFAAATLGGLILFPYASWSYWTREVFDIHRVGVPWRVADQSVRGTLIRLGLDSGVTADRLLMVAAVVSAAAVTLIIAALWWRRGEQLLAVSLTGVASVLASPISWAHHWCWIVPLLVALTRLSYRAAALTAVPFCVTIRICHHEWGYLLYHWGVFQNLVGNAYVWTAFLVVAYAAWRLRERPSDGLVGGVFPSFKKHQVSVPSPRSPRGARPRAGQATR